MDTILNSSIRSNTGKGVARKLRAAGQVPAVLYGPGVAPVPLAVNPEELLGIFNATGNRNTVVKLAVGDESIPVLVREVQRHPVERDILHVDFYRVPTDRQIEVMVAVRPVGTPIGAKLGGRLRIIRRQVNCLCRYDSIPEALVVDVSNMEINDIVCVSQIAVPDGTELLYDHDFNVLTVYGKRVKVEDAEEEAAAPAEEAE
jgi:large subunit ribosomal protein L25